MNIAQYLRDLKSSERQTFDSAQTELTSELRYVRYQLKQSISEMDRVKLLRRDIDIRRSLGVI